MGESTYQNLLQSSPQALNFDRVITLEEQYLYGSKRLGVRRPGLEMARAAHNPSGYEVPVEPTPPAERFGNACLCTEPIPGDEEPYYPGVAFTARFYTHTLGMKEYEITNHLGNVLATVLDRKTGVKASPTATTYAWFKADVTTAQDYYPFGSLMPGRTYVAPAGVGYRFGIQSWERQEEVYGQGNLYTTTFRMHDARIGKTWSMDPKLQYASPYIYLGNNPLNGLDPDGAWFWEKSHIRQARAYAKKTGGEFNKWRGQNGKMYASVEFKSASGSQNEISQETTLQFGKIDIESAVFRPGQDRSALLLSSGVGLYATIRATSMTLGGRLNAALKTGDAIVTGKGEYNNGGQPLEIEKLALSFNPIFNFANSLHILKEKEDVFGNDASSAIDQGLAAASVVGIVGPGKRIGKAFDHEELGQSLDRINEATQLNNELGNLDYLKKKNEKN